MECVVLFREGVGERGELEIVSDSFHTVCCRSRVPEGSLVIGRYSVLPFYKELEDDLATCGSRLINSYMQHRYVADVGNWYRDLSDITPKTWVSPYDIPEVEVPHGLVVKGETNSKKFMWDTHMFARDVGDATHVRRKLEEDSVICDQRIYFRRFEPLKTYMIGLRNMPVTHEFRVFVCDRHILTKAFYWSNYADDIVKQPEWPEPPDAFLNDAIERVGDNVRFYVVDVALKEDGTWTVIELNDGQMSGLSMTEPKELYARLRDVLT